VHAQIVEEHREKRAVSAGGQGAPERTGGMTGLAFVGAWGFLIGGVVEIAAGSVPVGVASLIAGIVLADFSWRRATR
ncbi:MAG: hypothetical protein WAM66_05555, partial [Acidobacteriaceae bacterium]